MDHPQVKTVMTFEQEVWDLVCAAAIKADMGNATAIAAIFAPRVAAAIEAAGHHRGINVKIAALAALRGDAP